MELALSPEERFALEETLEASLHRLREQIHHADHREFKASLKREEALLRNVLEKVRDLVPVGVSSR